MQKIDKFFLFTFLLFQVNFFDFINIRDSFLNGFASYSQKKLLLLIIIIYCAIKWTYIDKKNINYQRNKSYFSIFIFFLLVSWGIVFLGTVSIYGQSIMSTFFNSYYFLILILYFVYSRLMNSWPKWFDFIKIFVGFSTILSVTKILQSLFLSKFNFLLFFLNTNNDYNTAIQLKYMTLGFTRIPSASDFIFFGILLTVISLLSGQLIFSKYKLTIIFFTHIFYLFAVGQTRSYILITILLCIGYFLARIFKKFGNGGGTSIGIIFGIPIIFAFMSFLQSLLGNSSRSVALTIRQDALQYYLQNLDYSKLFAFGFLRDDIYGGLIHGIAINGMLLGFNYDDVGIFGFLAIFGRLGIFVIVIYCICLLRGYLYSKDKFLTLLLYIYLFGSWMSLSLFDPQRIFYLPILLALADFFTNQKVNNLKKER